MRRFLILALVCFTFGLSGLAQQNPADVPASKADVQRYLDAVHTREMIGTMMESMTNSLHQMIHEQFENDKDKLPADFEAQMSKSVDEMLHSLPFDEMVQATIPAYQKHFTKGDIDALVAFYTTPTGQKLLREMPAVMSESMDAMMPIVRKEMDAVTQHVQNQVMQMKKSADAEKNPAAKTPASQH